MTNDERTSLMSSQARYGEAAAFEATTAQLLEHLLNTHPDMLTPVGPLGMPLEVFHKLLAERNAYLGAIQALEAQQRQPHDRTTHPKPAPLEMLRRKLRQLRGT